MPGDEHGKGAHEHGKEHKGEHGHGPGHKDGHVSNLDSCIIRSYHGYLGGFETRRVRIDSSPCHAASVST